MNVLIVDDERLARIELKRLLETHDDIRVVGEAVNAEDAAKAIRKHRPDAVFMDIQMPGRNVFDMLSEMDHVPPVIFTTAFDQYALKAFEINALDYLMKPIDPERLGPAIDRLRQQIGAASSGKVLSHEDRVFLRDGERCWFVSVRDIRVLESEGNYCRVYFDSHRPLIPRSLHALEERLDPSVFFRANRQQIINLNWIDRIDEWFDQSLKVVIKGGMEITLSRRQAQKFRQMKTL